VVCRAPAPRRSAAGRGSVIVPKRRPSEWPSPTPGSRPLSEAVRSLAPAPSDASLGPAWYCVPLNTHPFPDA
jgi:hypothetical protein